MKSPLVALLLILASVTSRASTFVVSNTNDTGPGSLYQAITDANADWDQDTIVFNIPRQGVHVIDVSANPLPQVVRPVMIDGYTQPGSHPNTLPTGDNAVILIQVKGRGLGPAVAGFGFWIKGGSTLLRGLSITDFDVGILLDGPLGGNAVEGNFIGLDPSGRKASPNDGGVTINSVNSTLGGSEPAQRNVISGNRNIGVSLGAPAMVAGNYIGTNASGDTAMPNRIGIKVIGGSADSHTVIGGIDSNSANLVSGNLSTGIQIGDFFNGTCPSPPLVCFFDNSYPANYTVVSNNLIGVTADGTGRLGNGTGIFIYDSNNTVIGGGNPVAGNIVAFNTYAGVAVQNFISSHPCVGNSILSNRIYANGTRNIVLEQGRSDAPLANDLGDTDTGPNNLQNYPFLTGSSIANGIVTSHGTLNSIPNTQFLIQCFADSRSISTPSQVYLGSTTVTTDGNGNAAYSVQLPISDDNVFINATATNLATGDTSEFYYNAPRLLNVSTRLRVGTGENVLIAGFIVGPEGGVVIVRGLGPSLKLAGALQDPVIYLYDGAGKLLGISDNWRNDTHPIDPSAYGLAPTNDSESALGRMVGPGAYTVVLEGKNGSSGLGLVEVYLVTPGVSPASGNDAALANISTRGMVDSGDNVMIAGFISADSNGPARYLIRAIGPSLKNFGISNPLADPSLELHDGNGALIAFNDDWKDGDENSILDTGLAPQNAAESVILDTLQPGAYTAIVRGKADATGVALVEVYNLH